MPSASIILLLLLLFLLLSSSSCLFSSFPSSALVTSVCVDASSSASIKSSSVDRPSLLASTAVLVSASAWSLSSCSSSSSSSSSRTIPVRVLCLPPLDGRVFALSGGGDIKFTMEPPRNGKPCMLGREGSNSAPNMSIVSRRAAWERVVGIVTTHLAGTPAAADPVTLSSPLPRSPQQGPRPPLCPPLWKWERGRAHGGRAEARTVTDEKCHQQLLLGKLANRIIRKFIILDLWFFTRNSSSGISTTILFSQLFFQKRNLLRRVSLGNF